MRNGKIRDSKIRAAIIDFAKGDFLWFYWKLFAWYNRISYLPFQDILSFFLLRIAHKHGGYIGRNATFQSKPVLPHGLHGIYISRYAKIGRECHIYQNVTIGSVGKKAPQIGNYCLIGAGATIVGDIKIGDHVKIGAGAVVFTDVPNHSTVVAGPPRMIVRGPGND